MGVTAVTRGRESMPLYPFPQPADRASDYTPTTVRPPARRDRGRENQTRIAANAMRAI